MKARKQGLKNTLVETLDRLVTAKLGNLCHRPQILFDNIFSLFLDEKALSFHLLVTKMFGQK